jgi:acetoacetyl-CoA synthetase
VAQRVRSEDSNSTETTSIIWEATDVEKGSSQLVAFLAWVNDHKGLHLVTYRDALDWSTRDISAFWGSVREFFDVLGTGFDGQVLSEESMPGAQWFPGSTVNFAANALRYATRIELAETPAIIHIEEDGASSELTWRELGAKVASLAASLRGLGVTRGDRVVAVLPNIPEAIIGLLASASIGATWCICSPDLAAKAAIDRLAQLEPTVLIGSLGYEFNGKWFDRVDHLDQIIAGIPTLSEIIVVTDSDVEGRLRFSDLLQDRSDLKFEDVPFDHPLWVLFTSGTTGKPKGIVHGHGGMTLEFLKMFGLHFDMGVGGRYYVAANTSWMVWDTIIGNLMVGASVVTYAGSPVYPNANRQFEIVATTEATMLATGAAYLRLLQGSGIEPGRDRDLSKLRNVMSTGSTLPGLTYEWFHQSVSDSTHLCDTSGGTDICSAFVGPNILEPVRRGRIQGPLLGVAIEVRNEAGVPVIDEVGELVITRPMPSMPLRFWGDKDGSQYRGAYFEQFPGVWTHGDWVIEGADGTFEVLGRSDATLNRSGVRLGSSEIYTALVTVPQIVDSLVLGIDLPEGDYYLPLFVVLADGVVLDPALREAIAQTIRNQASARHIPDDILVAPAIPVTHAGKKIEIPIKRLFMGVDPSKVDRGSLANPDALDWFVAEAKRFRASKGLAES